MIRFETCVCGKLLMEQLYDYFDGRPIQNNCPEHGLPASAEKAIVGRREGASLQGWALGDRVEADLWRGGHQDEDGITTGSRLVTKQGSVHGVLVFPNYNSTVWVKFDDGDHQTCVLDPTGAPGASSYPCEAIRRL